MSGLELLAGGYVSKDLVLKMLGPTADYIGEGLQAWTQRSVNNIQHVLGYAVARLGSGINEPGAIPVRVLGAVFEHAQYAEDQVMAEYLGGILASSRSGLARDDRAAATAASVGRLSTYAIRAHYLLYTAAHQVVAGTDHNFRMGETVQLYVPATQYDDCMEFSEAERGDLGIHIETLFSLDREGLLGNWASGTSEVLRVRPRYDPAEPIPPFIQEPGLTYAPTAAGIVLFSTAQGVGGDGFAAFTTADRFSPIDQVPVPTAVTVDRIPDFPIGEVQLGA